MPLRFLAAFLAILPAAAAPPTGMNPKALGDPSADLAYTPVLPCRLVDTRGFGAPFQGGAFASGERRAYAPNGACNIPTAGVATLMMVFASQNLREPGGFITILGPNAPITGLSGGYGSEWISASAAVSTGTAGQFDVYVNTANAHVIIDVVGYFRAPSGLATGTVTSVATGAGLTGGPITTTGTVGLAATQLLPTTACAGNQVPKWSGTAWACGDDMNTPGSGTVSSVATGSGLTGGPITTTGTINLAATQLLPTTQCNGNEIPKWNGTAWTCSADGPANAFVQGGNAFGAAAVIGSTDNNATRIVTNGFRGLQVQHAGLDRVNVLAGSPLNSIGGGVVGATISGGGGTVGADMKPNLANGNFATVGGGANNRADGDTSTIGGGDGNRAQQEATVGGGLSNHALGTRSVVAGGLGNQATAMYSSVAGGATNSAIAQGAALGGGQLNDATAPWSTVAGGLGNSAEAQGGAIGGGDSNRIAAGNSSTIAGGASNQIFSAPGATIGGGTGNIASNAYATVPGGRFNLAAGVDSFAAGQGARATHDQSFVWSGIGNSGTVSSTVAGQFMAMAPGGFKFYSAGSFLVGADLPSGSGTWSSFSDRNVKKDLARIDPRSVLAKVASLPLYTWRYMTEASGALHMGPVAQDFRATFGLGDGDRTISVVDADGVAFAAIQGLHQRLEEKEARIGALERELKAIRVKLGM